MGGAVLLNKDLLDRIIVARLIEAPPENYPLPPLQYLMACYQRALDELRNKPVAGSPDLTAVVGACRELIISYASLTLGGGIIPHPGPVVSVRKRTQFRVLECGVFT